MRLFHEIKIFVVEKGENNRILTHKVSSNDRFSDLKAAISEVDKKVVGKISICSFIVINLITLLILFTYQDIRIERLDVVQGITSVYPKDDDNVIKVLLFEESYTKLGYIKLFVTLGTQLYLSFCYSFTITYSSKLFN